MKWARLPYYQSAEVVPALPMGWAVHRIDEVYEPLPKGRLYAKKECVDGGQVPVLDQSEAGIIGFHNDAPGVEASDLRPVVTFANHTCEMRWVKFPFSVIQNVFPMVGRGGVCDTRYLYYATKGRVWLEEYKGHYPDYRRAYLPLPPLDEQRRIAAVLGALDDKIELNRKMNRTLEDMAQAIFKSWFIDFDGVPDSEMVESELGPIPKGWEVKRGDHVAAVAIGKTPPRKEPHWFSTSHDDIRWMSIKDMGNCGAYISQTSEFLTAAAVDKFNVRRIPDNTVVLSFKLTVGRVAITVGEMLSNEAIAHFRLDGGSTMTPEYLYCYLSSFRYESLGSTSSIARAVNSKMIKAMPILVPPDGRIAEFASVGEPIFRRMKHLQAESATLAALRDALLPKLISGEIRVPDVEEAVEAAL